MSGIIMPGAELMLFTGNANRPLVQRIATYLGKDLGKVVLEPWDDGEENVQFIDNVRGQHVVIIQPTTGNDRFLVEALVLVRAACSASAGQITVMFPYFGYSRSDRKDKPRTPILGRLMVDLFETAGANRLFFFELHASQLQGFVDVTKMGDDHLFAGTVFRALIRHLGITGFMNTGADLGRTRVAQKWARVLGEDLCAVVKGSDLHRAGKTLIIGDVRGRNVRIVDDETSTGGTIHDAAVALKDAGAAEIHAVIPHAKFAGAAVATLVAAPVERYFIGDTIAFPEEAKTALGDRLTHVTFAPLLGEAIRRVHEGASITSLFEEEAVTALYRGSYTI